MLASFLLPFSFSELEGWTEGVGVSDIADFESAQYYIDSETLTHYVHAVRPIAVDEEITISCKCFFSLNLGMHKVWQKNQPASAKAIGICS